MLTKSQQRFFIITGAVLYFLGVFLELNGYNQVGSAVLLIATGAYIHGVSPALRDKNHAVKIEGAVHILGATLMYVINLLQILGYHPF